jgi:GT2 family glycosyltransferase
VVNWNGREDLADCLGAVLAQEPAPTEVVVVDNHSDDGSREMVAERYPTVRVLDTGANLGAAAARNRGARETRGDRILFIDNDVVMRPGALSAMTAALDADPRCAVAQARSLVADRLDVVHYDAADLHYLGTLVLHHWFAPLAGAGAVRQPVGAVIALCLLVRRDAFVSVGGFRDELFILYEDNDLSWRMRMHGHVLRLCADALVEHRGGTAGLSFRSPDARYAAQRTYLHVRNRWIVLLACMRWRTLLLTLPAQVVYAVVYTAFAFRRGHVIAPLRGHLAGVGAMFRLGTLRRAQRGRTVPDRELLVALPMTANPGLADRGWKAGLRRGLDRFFAFWWRLIRRLCG